MAVQRLPSRSQVRKEDTWDLSLLFSNDDAWEQAFRKLERKISQYEKFRGTLSQSAAQLATCLKFDLRFEREADRLGTYAHLRTTEDHTSSDAERRLGRFTSMAVRASQVASFIRPEIMAIPDSTMRRFLTSKELADYATLLHRLLRYKAHTLSDKEERLLAMQGEMAQTAQKAFNQLLDSDLKFGAVRDDKGREIELSNSTFMQFLISPDRNVRKTAFFQYYKQFQGHENSLAAILNGSMQGDVYYARARGYSSALDAALFPDRVPRSVYENLLATVRKHLPSVHHFYEVRRRKMRIKDIHHYDTYVPILSDLEKRHTWKQAVDVILKALQPLGSEYCGVLEKGLRGRWCDRYPNQGKHSGAFSSGCYDSEPYILMNYKPEVFGDVLTLAHEAGHSMHTHLSSKHQPYQYSQYTIFVAEVASTFNEELVIRHLLKTTDDKRERAYLINRKIDDIRATIVRQTMFAEFEKLAHERIEAGEPLTVQTVREIYRGLLDAYFGPDFVVDKELELECLRIPHFYRAFYVYKYSTGLAAAISLSERVLEGGEQELSDYLNFLQGGCSEFPLDLLRGAGVDMESPAPIDTALRYFDSLVKELDELL